MKGESRIQKKITEWLNANDFIAIKIPGSVFLRGIPDIIAVRRGRAYLFEVKTDKGELTKLQGAFLRKFDHHGAVCAVVRSLDDVKHIAKVTELNSFDPFLIRMYQEFKAESEAA